MSTRTKAIIVILSVILFVFGIAIYGTFIHWFLIKREGITYISDRVSGQFDYMVLFSLTITVIPLSAFVLKLKKIKNILISAGILMGFVLIAIVIKRTLLLYNIERFYMPSINGEKLQYPLSLRQSSPETYMVVALILGYILLIVLKSQRILFRNDYE